ncbi:hemicentin-2-like [Synchiropus splendidus]|uniref:hemicentin-2-like n=1 Tax=Synchiropus splendidus TaxID=270530 RepID=UPI00237EC831|nr:hemicentin-2-like [Synchiropus splendidus]
MTGVLRIILMYCLIQGSRCQTFSISLEETLDALSGSCVVVSCTFTVARRYEDDLDTSCKAIWKVGKTTVFDSSENSNLLDGHLEGNLVEKNCTTIFNNLQWTHSDRYRMRIECDGLAYNFAKRVAINVQESLPSPSITQPTLVVVEGAELQLSCSAPAPCPISPPVLTWSPVLGETQQVSMTSLMTFKASYIHNGLRVACLAQYVRQGNSDFYSQSNALITVFFSPRQPNITYSGPVTEGSRVTLTCDTTANPSPDYIWYQEVDHSLVPLGRWRRLSVTATEQNNRFHCEVKNYYGLSSSAAAIDVRFPPKDLAVTVNVSGPIVEGQSVVLTCSSRANPPVSSYTWYQDDVEMTEHNVTFSVDTVELRHGGHYKCEAMNDIGRGTSPALLLDVQYAPKNTSVSVDPPAPVSDGSSVTLTCTSRANPAQVNVTWYRVVGSGKQALGSGEALTFNATKLSQELYFCEAENIHGTESSEVIHIEVTFAAKILPSSRCVKIQSHWRCNCDSHGNPPPEIRWELPSVSLDNQTFDTSDDKMILGSFARRSLVMLSLLNQEKPYVVCVSTNLLGSDTLVFNISSSDPQQGLSPVPLLVGLLVGALSVVLLCIPLLYFLFSGRKGYPPSDTSLVNTSDYLGTSESNSEISTIYANKDMIEKEERSAEEQLHYARVDFTKLRAHSDGQQGEGQIRGLSSKTAEYAEIRLYSRERDQDEATVTETAFSDEVDS